MKFAVCFVVLLICSSFRVLAGPLSIRASDTYIVKATNATTFDGKAARILQRYLRQSFGDSLGFKIIQEKEVASRKGTFIALGKTRWYNEKYASGLKKYGYRVVSVEDTICVYGNHDLSVLLGATALLDSVFDIRFYLPGKDFVHCPSRSELNLQPFDFTSEPYTDYVMGTGFLTDFMNEYEVAECWGLIRKDWGSHQHTMSERFPAEKYAEKYADLYPMKDSNQHYFPKDRNDQSWQPDFANPEMITMAVQSAVEFFKKNPSTDVIAFSVQDSDAYQDTPFLNKYRKKTAKTRQGDKRTYTNAYVHFINATAVQVRKQLKKNDLPHPKTIAYIAYGRVNQVPVKKLKREVLPILVFRIIESDVLHLYDSLGNPRCIFQPYQWKSKTHRIGVHDWGQGYGYLTPRIYTSQWQRYLKAVRDYKMKFEYAHVECYPNWGLDGPKYYLLSKVLWNPDVNTDQLLRQFCADMFGNQVNGMNEYFKGLEEWSILMNNRELRRKMWRIPEQLYLNEQEMVLAQRCMGIVQKCLKDSESDPIVHSRIQLFHDSFRMSLYLCEIANYKGIYTEAEIQLIDTFFKATLNRKGLLHTYWGRNQDNLLKMLEYVKISNH